MADDDDYEDDDDDDDDRFIKPTEKEIIKALNAICSYAEDVMFHLKASPGGDKYEYVGSMNTVEHLRTAFDEYHSLLYRPKEK